MEKTMKLKKVEKLKKKITNNMEKLYRAKNKVNKLSLKNSRLQDKLGNLVNPPLNKVKKEKTSEPKNL